MDKLLLGTTNQGKVDEMKEYLAGLDMNILSLNDLQQDIKEPDEPHDTIEENAFLKARYYANKTNLISLSDDGGLFVDALNGWPGVKSARVAENSEKRRRLILDMLEKKKTNDRSASFRSVLSLYDPQEKIGFSNMGMTKGKITKQPEETPKNGFGYDPIFKVKKSDKTYASMNKKEKNNVSHRGKALFGIVDFIKFYYNK
ncbi:MAG: RdgB/HAM1 family non-canonical purine NTP pyrophosphatase [Candidatus Paceibacteria bacterium]